MKQLRTKTVFEYFLLWMIFLHWLCPVHADTSNATATATDAVPYTGLGPTCTAMTDENAKNSCLANACSSYHENSNRYNCQINYCSQMKDEIQRKDCRMNFAAEESSNALSPSGTEKTLGTLKTVMKVANVVSSVLSLVVRVIQTVIQKFKSGSWAKAHCQSASALVAVVGSVVATGVTVAKLIYNIVATKQLVDKFNNDTALFGIFHPKDGNNENPGETPQELQRKYFEYLIAQNTIQLTSLRIELAGHWAYAAILYVTIALAVVEQVVMTSGNMLAARKVICDFGMKTGSDDFRWEKMLESLMQVMPEVHAETNNITSIFSSGIVTSPVENQDGVKAKAVLKDAFAIGTTGISIISTAASVIAILVHMIRGWTVPTAEQSMGKALIFPVMRIIFFTAEAVLTTGIAIITTIQMVMVQKRNDALNQVLSNFDAYTQNSTQIDLNATAAPGASPTFSPHTLYDERPHWWNQLINFLPEANAEVLVQSAEKNMRDYRLCADQKLNFDPQCECRKRNDCLRFPSEIVSPVLMKQPVMQKIFKMGDDLLKGERSPLDLDVPEVQDMALKMKKMSQDLYQQNDRVDPKTGKHIFPPYAQIEAKSLDVFKGLNIPQEVFDSYSSVEQALSPANIFLTGIKQKSPQVGEKMHGIMQQMQKISPPAEEPKTANISTSDVKPEVKALTNPFDNKGPKEEVAKTNYHLVEGTDIHDNQEDIWKIVSNAYQKKFSPLFFNYIPQTLSPTP